MTDEIKNGVIRNSIDSVDKAAKTIDKLNENNSKHGHELGSTGIIQWLVLFFAIVLVGVVGYLTMRIGNLTKTQSATVVVELKEDMTDIKKSQEKIANNIIIIMQDIGIIKSDLPEQFDKKTIEILAAIVESQDRLYDLIIKGKPFSNEEMHALLSNRFELSITHIKDYYKDEIKNNGLWEKKELVLDVDTITNKIKEFVYEGRTFIYGRNFDKRILNTVFYNTDTAVELAAKAIYKSFEDFYNVPENEVKEIHYKILSGKIEGIANKIEVESQAMLKREVLGVKE